METKALKPTFSCRLQSSTAVHRAPLWLIKPTLPGRAMVLAKVAFRPLSGRHHSQAVRSDDAHVAAPGMLHDLAL